MTRGRWWKISLKTKSFLLNLSSLYLKEELILRKINNNPSSPYLKEELILGKINNNLYLRIRNISKFTLTSSSDWKFQRGKKSICLNLRLSPMQSNLENTLTLETELSATYFTVICPKYCLIKVSISWNMQPNRINY